MTQADVVLALLVPTVFFAVLTAATHLLPDPEPFPLPLPYTETCN